MGLTVSSTAGVTFLAGADSSPRHNVRTSYRTHRASNPTSTSVSEVPLQECVELYPRALPRLKVSTPTLRHSCLGQEQELKLQCAFLAILHTVPHWSCV